MLQAYPLSNNDLVDVNSAAEIDWLKEFIIGVRKIRSEMDIPPSKQVPVLLQQCSTIDIQRVETHRHALDKLAKLDSITILRDKDAPESALALVGEMKILIPLAGLIDKEEELKRLSKDIAKLESNIEKTRNKLHNPNFKDRAPVNVVAKEQERLAEQEKTYAELLQQQEKMNKL